MNPIPPIPSAGLDAPTPALSTAARACLVNRTHRIVRARAGSMQARRRRTRGLLLPLIVASAMLLLLCYALWTLFDEYELNPNGLPDASSQLFVLLLWFLPVTAAVLGAVWFRRLRYRNREDAAQ